MSLIERDLLVISQKIGSLDIQPRGTGCDHITRDMHDFNVTAKVGEFIYEICGRCCTVRISERRL